jgi:hypothetical protein
MIVHVWVNDIKCTQRLICVVVVVVVVDDDDDDLVIVRFKTEHLPTEGKVSEGKDHQHPFCFSFQTWYGDCVSWHKTLGENRRERRPLWKCGSGSDVKNLRSHTDHDGLDFCIQLNKIQPPWRRTQPIPPKHRYRVGPYIQRCQNPEDRNMSISSENLRTERMDSVGSRTWSSDGFLSTRERVRIKGGKFND